MEQWLASYRLPIGHAPEGPVHKEEEAVPGQEEEGIRGDQ